MFDYVLYEVIDFGCHPKEGISANALRLIGVFKAPSQNKLIEALKNMKNCKGRNFFIEECQRSTLFSV